LKGGKETLALALSIELLLRDATLLQMVSLRLCKYYQIEDADLCEEVDFMIMGAWFI